MQIGRESGRDSRERAGATPGPHILERLPLQIYSCPPSFFQKHSPFLLHHMRVGAFREKIQKSKESIRNTEIEGITKKRSNGRNC